MSHSDLESRIAELEQHNAFLAKQRVPGHVWRAWVSALIIVVASVLAPLSVGAAWVRANLVNEDRFISTFAPLSENSDVQLVVTESVNGVIKERVDIAGQTKALIQGLAGLDLPPAAKTALGYLEGPASAGAESLAESVVGDVVASDTFSAVWRQVLSLSHKALDVATEETDANSAIMVSPDGTVSLQLDPIITPVKNELEKQGFGFASSIPTTNVSIALGTSEGLAQIRVVYALADTVGYWMLVGNILLFGVGIAFARRRVVAVVGSGVGLAIGTGVALIAIPAGGSVIASLAASTTMPIGALHAAYSIVSASLMSNLWLAFTIGVLTALIGATQTKSAWATSLRASMRSLNDSIGENFSSVRDSGFGVWLRNKRVLVRAIIIALVAVVVIFLPNTWASTIVTAVVGLLLWWGASILEAPESDAELLTEDVHNEDTAITNDAEALADELREIGGEESEESSTTS